MTKKINGDLILTKDTTFEESIEVDGAIRGLYNLKVCGNIVCGNIDCWNIVCGNIDCWNIVCGNIDCWNIDCGNIDCWNIDCGNIDCGNIVYCEKIKVKKGCKVTAKHVLKNRFSKKVKEWKV